VGIAARIVELEDGEAWTDIVTVRFRRDEAMMLSVILSNHLDDTKDVIAQANAAMENDDNDILTRLAAGLAAEKLHESWGLAGCAHAAIGAKIAPVEQRKDLANALAEAREQRDAKARKDKE
jgi:hypothetical protein